MRETIRSDAMVVVGLGNPLLCDDTIGLIVTEQLRRRFVQQPGWPDFKLSYSGGLDLLYDLEGYRKAAIIDAVITGTAEPGTLHEFTLDEIPSMGQPRLMDSHGLDLLSVIDIGRCLGYEMPCDIKLFGIEGTDFERFSEEPSPEVAARVPEIIAEIEGIIMYWNGKMGMPELSGFNEKKETP